MFNLINPRRPNALKISQSYLFGRNLEQKPYKNSGFFQKTAVF